MENLAKALAEYFTIVKGIAEEYGNGVTVNIVKVDHPELGFMDDDEIDEILGYAEKYRNRLTSR